MMPLAATECVQESGLIKLKPAGHSDQAEETKDESYIDQYVNELLVTSLSGAATSYQTNLFVDFTQESPEKRAKMQTS